MIYCVVPEALAGELKAEPQGLAAAGRQRLLDRHGIQVRIVPLEVLPDSVRRYDHHRRRLMLSELLGEAGRTFSIAYQLALAEHDAEETRLGREAARRDYLTADEAERLLDGEHPVKVWRGKRGLTQRALAKAAGMQPGYLAEIETGRKPGSAGALSRLSTALGVAMGDLVRGTRG